MQAEWQARTKVLSHSHYVILMLLDEPDKRQIQTNPVVLFLLLVMLMKGIYQRPRTTFISYIEQRCIDTTFSKRLMSSCSPWAGTHNTQESASNQIPLHNLNPKWALQGGSDPLRNLRSARNSEENTEPGLYRVMRIKLGDKGNSLQTDEGCLDSSGSF